MKHHLETFLSNHPKKYLIFDFDHTLFTLNLPWGEYLDNTYRMLREYNPDFYNEHQHKEDSNYELINRFTKEFGTEVRDMALEYACRFEKEKYKGVTEHEELTSLLKGGKEKYTFFLWTSNCTTTVKPILEEYQLLEMFRKIVGRDSVTYTKPDPDGFSLITEDLDDFKKSEFVMVGDSSSDERAAEAAGIDFVPVYT